MMGMVPLDDVRSARYDQNQVERPPTGLAEPCAICGYPVGDPSIAKWVRIVASGAMFAQGSDSDVEDPTMFEGDLGWFPIGRACERIAATHGLAVLTPEARP